MVGVIRFAAPGQRHDGAVVKVVVPEPVQSVAALLQRPNQPDVLRLVLGDEDDRPPAAASRARRPITRRDVRRSVSWMLCVASSRKPVEMELVDPVRGVAAEVLPHRAGVRPVEVQPVTPFVRVRA